jgi:AAA15 family ATPase/GTPase
VEKIKHIEINNFKSIKHLKINGCNRINVFIGMPNAGKSNILEALGLFGKINNSDENLSSNINLKDFVRFNRYSELFFEENISEQIEIKTNSILIEIYSKEELNNGNFKYSSTYRIDNYLSYSNSNIKLPFDDNLDVEDLSKIKKYQFLEVNFEESENKTTLNYPSGENLVQVLTSNPEIRKIVNQIFKENNLRLLIEKHTNELKIFKEYQDGTVFTLPYNLIADTLQRLIFFKTAILSNDNSVLLFEEPEAHCFEPYILEFTNSVKYDKKYNQFFIVTHSDFIIQEFLRDEESKNNTNIYLVNNVNGETKVKLLNKNKNEDVYELGMNPFFNFENLWENN